MDPGFFSAFAFFNFKKLGGITSRQPAVLVYNLGMTSSPQNHHLPGLPGDDMTSDDRSRSQQQDALVRDLKKEILELRTQLEQVPTVPEDGPIPRGGYGGFFWGEAPNKKKVQLFQGGTPRKIRCFRTFQLYVCCGW